MPPLSLRRNSVGFGSSWFRRSRDRLRALLLLLRTVRMANEPRHLEFDETHVFVSTRYVVTVRHGSLKIHQRVRAENGASHMTCVILGKANEA